MRDLVLDLLSGYRLTRVVLDDSRHFPPLAGLRVRTERTLLRHPPWATVLDCEWCASAWVGLGIVVARKVAPRAWRAASLALGVSAASGLLTGVEARLNRGVE